MNRIYHLIFNQALNIWQLAPEIARGRRKSRWALVASAWVFLSAAAAPDVQADSRCTAIISGRCIIDGGASVTVDTGETWDLEGKTLVVGYDGEGTLKIIDGHVKNGASWIGHLPDSEGAVTVKGPEAAWHSNAFIVGIGRVEVLAGAQVEAEVHLTLGSGDGGEGTALVDGVGSKIVTGQNTTIGQHGTGLLEIRNGGVVEAGWYARVGEREDVVGTVLVSGTGSKWDISKSADRIDKLTVGVRGHGTLSLENGGTVNVNSGTGTVVLADEKNSTGILNIGAGLGDNGQPLGAVAAGTLEAGEIEFGRGAAILNFNHTDNNHTFDVALASVNTEDGRHQVRHLAGTTILSGDNSGFTGTTIVDGGTLVAGHTDAFADNAAYIVNGGTLDLNDQSLTMSSLSSDSNSTGGLVSVGEADLILDQNIDTVYAGRLMSNTRGTLHKSGPGTLMLTGDNTGFSGETRISGGALLVGNATGSGALGGTLTVASGGVLGGSGVVGTTTIESGGTLAPGNSLGTITVNGNLNLTAGSRIEVEVNPSGNGSDRVHVTGEATLGGSVVHVGLGGIYRPESRYTILTADRGLQGTFDDVTSDFAFLTPTLDIDYNNFTVDLFLRRNDLDFATLARTPNQRATAWGLQSLPASSALLQEMLTLPRDTPASFFDGLSGEVHATVASALLQGTEAARTVPLSQLRARLKQNPVFGTALWADVTGSWRDVDGDGNAASLRQQSGGVVVGGDHGLGAGWRLGLALGYADHDIRVRRRDSSADVESYSATVYAGKIFEAGAGQLSVTVGGGYTHHRIKTGRHAVINDWSHRLSASYRGDTRQVFGEIGYALPVGTATVEPFAGLAWHDVRTRRFTESGGPTALSVQRQNNDVTTSTLGVRARLGFMLGQSEGRFHGSVGWRHAFGDTSPESTHAFAAGRPFTVSGVPIAQNSAVIETGLQVNVAPRTSLGVAYRGQFASNLNDHGVNANLSIRF